jgi:hypothetical protein
MKSFRAVYILDICHYLNDFTSYCDFIVDSSLRGGFRVYSMFLREASKHDK